MAAIAECIEQTSRAEFSLRPSRRRVLVVEDEALIAWDIKGRLENSGYEVPAIAASADMALRLAARYAPDLILMDIRLQGGRDGIEAAAEVRRQMDIPVIFLTSHSDVETLKRARSSEPFGYVVKPFGSLNFRALIEIALQKHETESALRESVGWHNALETRRLMRLFEGTAQDADPVEDSPAQRASEDGADLPANGDRAFDLPPRRRQLGTTLAERAHESNQD
jgi:DNA-binding response OmpR family regulator